MTRQFEAASRSSRATLTPLDEVTLEHLKSWGLRDTHIYRAAPGEKKFAPLDVRQHADDEALHKKSEQTLIICPSQEIADNKLPMVKWTGIINARVDVRWFFFKNSKKRPLYFDGHGTNPWRNDDIIFHIPYFQHVDNDGQTHECGSGAEYVGGESWCFRDDYRRQAAFRNGKKAAAAQNSPESSSEIAFSHDGRKQRRTDSFLHQFNRPEADEVVKLCFEKRCMTICMLPDFPADQDPPRPETHPRSKCQTWTSLFIAPEDIIAKDGNLDEALLDGDLEYRRPADDSYGQRKSWENVLSDRNADYFQMCLIEVGFRKIARQCQLNMNAIDTACRVFNNKVHANIHSNAGRSAYWRGGVDKDLLNAYKLQTRLENLQINLSMIIDRKQGVWHNFRNARPRKRQGELHNKNNKTREEEAEYLRLKFLLFFCADRQADRLYGFRERIKAKIEKLRTLRELLVELSQTRASLYANDLGDNVMYLTYFSILFLPLGFCASLWSMNHELPYAAFVPTICATSILTVLLLVYIIITFRMKDQ